MGFNGWKFESFWKIWSFSVCVFLDLNQSWFFCKQAAIHFSSYSEYLYNLITYLALTSKYFLHQVFYLLLMKARWVEVVKSVLLSIIHSRVNIFSLSIWKLLEEVILRSVELIVTKLVTEVLIFMARGYFFSWNVYIWLSLTTRSSLILSILFLFHLLLSLWWPTSLSSSLGWN